MIRIVVVVIFVCCVALSFSSFADVVYLKNGSVINGTVVKQDAEKISIRVGTPEDAIEATYFNDEVLRIDKAQASHFIAAPAQGTATFQIPTPFLANRPFVNQQKEAQEENGQGFTLPSGLQAEAFIQGQAVPPPKTPAKTPEITPTATTKTPVQPPGKPKTQKPVEETLDTTTSPQRLVANDLLAGQEQVVKELLPLLDKKEEAYFYKLNSIVKNSAGAATRIFTDLSTLAQDPDQLRLRMNKLHGDINEAVEKMALLNPPPLFSRFQILYMQDLNVLRDTLALLVSGNNEASSRAQQLSDLQKQIQEELGKILENKKRTQQSAEK